MEKELDLFEQFLYEAPGDDPPPDMPGDTSATGPPDMPDIGSDDGGGGPPDMPDFGGEGDDGGGFGGDDLGGEGDTEGQGDPNNPQGLELDEKISAIMNMNLYQRYLALLNAISSQLSMIKNNSDVLYTLSSDSLNIIASLKKLDENIRLYIKNSFLHENYSKNLLFFNKCLNLLKLLNIQFDGDVQKGIKSME